MPTVAESVPLAAARRLAACTLAAALVAIVACEAPIAWTAKQQLPRLGVEIDEACAALPAEIEVAATGEPGREQWILAAPYRSEAAYAALGIEIEPRSLAALVKHGQEGPECLLVARLVDGRLVEFGHPQAACARGLYLGGELSAEPGVLALEAGDRLRLEAMPGGRVAVDLAARR